MCRLLSTVSPGDVEQSNAPPTVILLGSGAIPHTHTHTQEAAIQPHYGGAGKPTGPCTVTREACSPSTMGRDPSRNDTGWCWKPGRGHPPQPEAPEPAHRTLRGEAPAEVLETSGPTTCGFSCCLTGRRAEDRKRTEEKVEKKKRVGQTRVA